jgi:hypothetical protein
MDFPKANSAVVSAQDLSELVLPGANTPAGIRDIQVIG